mmetsp:Transcript_3581/g.11200  ORF Transcript_3581/g.11200 Transcript_3581/m.11200 type:complete len:269 (-) Transcript_3581:327-1133(-)
MRTWWSRTAWSKGTSIASCSSYRRSRTVPGMSGTKSFEARALGNTSSTSAVTAHDVSLILATISLPLDGGAPFSPVGSFEDPGPSLELRRDGRRGAGCPDWPPLMEALLGPAADIDVDDTSNGASRFSSASAAPPSSPLSCSLPLRWACLRAGCLGFPPDDAAAAATAASKLPLLAVLALARHAYSTGFFAASPSSSFFLCAALDPDRRPSSLSTPASAAASVLNPSLPHRLGFPLAVVCPRRRRVCTERPSAVVVPDADGAEGSKTA